MRFIKDYVGLDHDNNGHMHLDALCHLAYQSSLYHGRSWVDEGDVLLVRTGHAITLEAL